MWSYLLIHRSDYKSNCWIQKSETTSVRIWVKIKPRVRLNSHRTKQMPPKIESWNFTNTKKRTFAHVLVKIKFKPKLCSSSNIQFLEMWRSLERRSSFKRIPILEIVNKCFGELTSCYPTYDIHHPQWCSPKCSQPWSRTN